ncbi:hypothetical protein Scep_013984 [Stephania cephalantha]|uniref:Phosphotransferase n=1 Tax=Stephania cephalantha TaxID=152367 RepID=A0AAP0NZY0_9MAGN
MDATFDTGETRGTRSIFIMIFVWEIRDGSYGVAFCCLAGASGGQLPFCGGGGGDGVKGGWGERRWRGVAAAAACAVAAVMVSRRVKSRKKWNRIVGVLMELEEGCGTEIGRLRQVVDAMAVEMHAGLASEGGSKLKMLLTYIHTLPDGFDLDCCVGFTLFLFLILIGNYGNDIRNADLYSILIDMSEEGVYYSLDLGGTNFRVLRVHLGGQMSMILNKKVERQPIPRELMTGTSEELFDFIALTLKQLVESESSEFEFRLDERMVLGVTFSFPVKQASASSGTLIKWTKGFDIEDMVGKDVAESLQHALINRGLNMRVAALVNDTVGTLALGHYDDEDTVAAVIIGTGTNACYVERIDAIIKCQGLLTNSEEWYLLSPCIVHLIIEYIMGFEKMISGMYLGDIVRRVLLRMSLESDIFGDATARLSVPFALRTPLMVAMHEDETSDLREVGRILKEVFQISDVPLKVRKLVVRACDVITRRAARLAAAGIVGILKKIGRDGSGGIASGRPKSGGESTIKMKRSVVAVEGGLYSNYTMFRDYLHEAVSDILGEEIAPYVVLKESEDGSGIGAALLAASYSSVRKDHTSQQI